MASSRLSSTKGQLTYDEVSRSSKVPRPSEDPGSAGPTYSKLLNHRSAGNVLGFAHPLTRRPILAGFGALLAPEGRAVVGFGSGRGYDFEDFFADVEAVGLHREQTFSTWDLRRFDHASGFVVAVLGRA